MKDTQQVENAENNNYKKRYQVTKGWLKLFMITTIICLIVVAIIYVRFGMVDKKFKHKISLKDNFYNIKITNLKENLAYAQKDTISAQAELEVMNMKMKNIKNSDDLMARDIELYILKRYRRVPKIIAKAIAVSIVDSCKEEDVSPELVVGIAEIESQFNPMARNQKSGAIGSMQVMPEWAKKLGLKDVYELYDISTNIASGIKILKIHINEDAKGDLAKGLYFYVGKDSSYAARVFQASGKFAIFRSTVDDDKQTVEEDEQNENKKKEKIPDVVEPTDDKKGEPNDNATTGKQ